MKRMLLVVALALFASCVHADGDRERVLATVRAFVSAFNTGDLAQMDRTCADSATIVDDSAPPYGWAGQSACTKWMKAVGRIPGSPALKAEVAELLVAKVINVGGEYAYAVVPVNVTIRTEGRQDQSHLGVLTVALQRIGSVWRINALTYSPQ